MKKYYEILEVNPKASGEVIENAYNVLVEKYKPDLYEGDGKQLAEERLRDINEAYKILSDSFLRQQYDIELEKELEDDKNNKISSKIKRKKQNNEKKIFINNKEEKTEINNIGTYKGILNVVTEIFKNKPDLKEIKKLQKNDFIALGLTAFVMIVLIIILWFIPFTNGFVKSMLPFLK